MTLDFKSANWRLIKVAGLFSIPITLAVLPANFFDEGPSISLFALFGVEDYVYSTGLTKAIMHLIHFDFEGAMQYNKLSFVVLPLLFLLWLKLVLSQYKISVLKWF